MYDIFFSYPHKDSEKVMLILEALQARGLKIWIDRNEIRDFAGITRSKSVHNQIQGSYGVLFP